MKFRTEIEPFTLGTDIDYRSRLLALGSCFAEHIAARLSRARFRIEANPTGILFNPASIVRTLERLWHAEPVRREELHRSREGVWFHYDFHGSLSRPLSVTLGIATSSLIIDRRCSRFIISSPPFAAMIS